MAGSIPDRDDLVAEVADLVHAVTRRIGRAARAELGPLGVTGAQVRALRTLDGEGTPMRMGALAARLAVVPRSATSVVEDLVALGLVARTADAHDRRAVAVQPTAAGRALLERLATRRRSAADEVLAALTTDELESVRGLLARTGHASTAGG